MILNLSNSLFFCYFVARYDLLGKCCDVSAIYSLVVLSTFSCLVALVRASSSWVTWRSYCYYHHFSSMEKLAMLALVLLSNDGQLFSCDNHQFSPMMTRRPLS